MPASILDLFILSLFERGLETTYDLQRRGGLSLGSSVPALRRLEAEGLIRRKKGDSGGGRPRYGFAITSAGKKLARSGWKTFLKSDEAIDIEAVLRIAEMARGYKAKASDISRFLETASRNRLEMSKRTGTTMGGDTPDEYMKVRHEWNGARLSAEAEFLSYLAKSRPIVMRKKPKPR